MAIKFGWLVGFLFGSLSVLACSDRFTSCTESRTCSQPASEPTAGAAGKANSAVADGGEAGVAGASSDQEAAAGSAGAAAQAVACASDHDCDDGLRCNGTELCRDGSCHAGISPVCVNAASCVEDATQALCSYSDKSAWLTYVADEDTPGVDELYVVKESLIGTMAPIKVSGKLPTTPGEKLLTWSLRWSGDGAWLLFQTTLNDQESVKRSYAVHFEGGTPEAPIEITHGLPLASYDLTVSSSPTNHEVLLRGNGSVYWLPLSAEGKTVPLKVNLDKDLATSVAWVLGGDGLIYTTDHGRIYLVEVHPMGPTAPDPIGNPQSVQELYQTTSPDGQWVVFWTHTDAAYLLRVAFGASIVPLDQTPGGSTSVWFQFSPDSRYLAYSVEGKTPGHNAAYVISLTADGNAEQLNRFPVQQQQTLSSWEMLGNWARDSSFLQFFGDGVNPNPEEKTLYFFNTDTATSQMTPYVVGIRDEPAGVSPTSPVFTFSYQLTPGETELVALNPSAQGGARTYDMNSLGRQYQYVDFTRDGSEAVFCTNPSNANDQDMFFLDLRTSAFPHAVRLPGDGIAADCYADFAPDGKGFAYYRLSADGSRVLNWVDSSKQVLAKPVPVTREGRVLHYVWQPGVPAAKATTN